MGLEIDREHFAAEDHLRFRQRLDRCLDVLEELVATPGFGVGDPSIGAELEVALIDQRSRPLPLNESILRETLDERMTFELDRFNLECNLRHTSLAGRPFSHLRAELESARAELSRAAQVHDGRIAMIGILPTLLESDLQSSAMTDSVRYRAISRALRALREGPFELNIAGDDPLQLACEDVTFEGAATSLQIHLRTPPEDFTNVFNAAQMATAPLLAASGNSPTFLGRRLWSETRVALFKQAIDDRAESERRMRKPARVNFGSSWLSNGPIELFREAVTKYPALLPVIYDEDPDESLAAGRVPRLDEIRLHQGTIWTWNRPVYDPHEGGHVRLEFRALPSGPSIEDMLANTAFLIGLSLGLAPHMKSLCTRLDFDAAHHNFYRAAQSGLDARFDWPVDLDGPIRSVSAQALIPSLVDIARQGLLAAGIEAAETDPLIDCVAERAARGQTGAAWQRAALSALEATRNREEALAAMLERYVEHSTSGEPVHRWPLP